MKRDRTRTKLLAACLALPLVGCSSLALLPKTNQVMCQPTPPTLEWYATTDDGAFYPKPAQAELMNYIQDLNDCLHEYQRLAN